MKIFISVIIVLISAIGLLAFQTIFASNISSQKSLLNKTKDKGIIFRGTNLAGADGGKQEFSPEYGWGRYGTDYVYPIPYHACFARGCEHRKIYNSPQHFVEIGINVFRLPFFWQRLQPELGKPFDQVELQRLKTTVSYLNSLGAVVILDPHNFARYGWTKIIGSDDLPISHFRDFWSELSLIFKDNDYVIFGLMNEPVGIDTDKWVVAANAAIEAIRNNGANQLIFVPGAGYSGTTNWDDSTWYGVPNTRSNAVALKKIVDPIGNIVFEAHTYFDPKGSGTKPDCISPEEAIKRLKPFTKWLRDQNQRGFLGEFGVGSNDNCLMVLDKVLAYLENNDDVYIGWTYWAAGPWWGSDWPYSIEPIAEQNRQIQVMSQYLDLNKKLISK